MAGELVNLLADLNEAEAIEYVEKSLDKGVNPQDLMNETTEGMAIVGDRFANGKYFIPDLIFSGEILRNVIKILEPKLKEGQFGGNKKLGKIIVGTVEGDIHDIGKDIVVSMLDVNRFEVVDLGVDVPVQKFVESIKETGSSIVALSGFLTLAFDAMKRTVEAIRIAGLRDEVKIIIGGGQIDSRVQEYTGADAFGLNAMDAVKYAKQCIGG